MRQKKFPELKDYIYAMGIMVLIVIFILSGEVGGNVSLSNKLNFAATVTSILLAAIAIVISLIEGLKNARANENILNSSEVINSATEELSKSTELLSVLSKNLSNFDIASALEGLENKVDNSNNELSSLRSMFTSNPINNNQTTSIESVLSESKELTKSLIDSINRKNNNYHIKLLFFLSEIKDLNIESDEELTKLYTEVLNFDPKTNSIKNMRKTAVISQFAVLNKLNLINVYGPHYIVNPHIRTILSEYPKEIFDSVRKYIEYKDI